MTAGLKSIVLRDGALHPSDATKFSLNGLPLHFFSSIRLPSQSRFIHAFIIVRKDEWQNDHTGGFKLSVYLRSCSNSSLKL